MSGARIVEGPVERSVTIERRRDQPVNRDFVGDIRCDRGRLPTQTCYIGDEAFQRLLVARCEDDRRALGGDHARRGGTDPAAGAGDDHDLAGEVAHAASSSTFMPMRVLTPDSTPRAT